MVYYRKYRPQTIHDLDLTVVRNRLTNLLSQPDIPHALLFTGPKGLGKTSSARILAKAVNCESKQEGSIEPCNTCKSCVSITNGGAIDVLEIDAASNRGIDEIRELRERVKFSPAHLKKKVYIIDEVHMLTTEAFNALLKTLEEPPAHVLFILCTTEVHKVPATISSRTFHIPFEKPNVNELTVSLRRIAKGEGLSIEDEVLEKIYERSEGSFRDAAKIMEELSLSAEDKKITVAVFESLFKTQSIQDETQLLLQGLSEKDAKASLESISRFVSSGVDFRIVHEQMADLLRMELLAKAGVEKGKSAELFEIEDIEKLLSLLSESYAQLRYAILPQLPLELLVVSWCYGKKIDERIPESTPEVSEKPSVKKEVAKKTEDVQSPKQASRIVKQAVISMGDESPEQFYQELIEAVKLDNHSIAGFLRGCSIVAFKDDVLTLETPYTFHKDKLSENKNSEIIEKRAGEILGKKITLSVTIKE